MLLFLWRLLFCDVSESNTRYRKDYLMSSIVLVGMPGAGKSTVGVLLAKEVALDFIDTDLLIQRREHKTLQEILDDSDYLALRQIEERVILENEFFDAVVATGGSVVHGEKGMAKLKAVGPIVYLSCAPEELKRRIHNWSKRGIACAPDQSFETLVEEREQLYRDYANLEVKTDGLNPEEVVRRLLSLPLFG